MSIYTVPPLDGVDFALTSATPGSVVGLSTGLIPYTVPALDSVDFALTSYSLPTFSGIDFEIGEVDTGVTSVDVTDTASLSLTETVDGLAAYSDLTESASLALDESVAIDVIADITDDAALGVSESAEIEVVAEATDDAALSVTESVEIEVIAEQAIPLITGGGADRGRRKKKRAKVYWDELPAEAPKPVPVVLVEAASEPELPRVVIDVPELLDLGREIRRAINDEIEQDDEDILSLVALL